MNQERSATFQEWIQRAFWTLISLLAMIALNKVSAMSKSIEQLNSNVAVLVSQVAIQGTISEKHSAKIEENTLDLQKIKDRLRIR